MFIMKIPIILYTFIILLMSKIIWNINKLIVNCEQKFNQLYTNYKIVRHPIDLFCYVKTTITEFFYNTLKEPPYDCWTGLYQLINNNLTYVYHIKKLDNIEDFNNNNSFFNPFTHNIVDKNNVCIVSKYKQYYKIFHSQTNPLNDLMTSNGTFLSVFYNHPKMNDSIELTIPREMLLIDNQLFNATFILRCLKQIKMRYVFDNEYTIQIMDSEINEYNIKYGHYLHVNKDNFEIKSL